MKHETALDGWEAGFAFCISYSHLCLEMAMPVFYDQKVGAEGHD